MFKQKGNNMKINLLPLTRLFMFQCLLTMIIAMPFSDANAQRRGGSHQGGGHHGGGVYYPNNNQFQNTIDSTINRYLQHGNRVNLNRSLNLQQVIAQGKQIVSLSVKAQSTQYNSRLILLLNGQRIQAQGINSYMSDSFFSIPILKMRDQLVLVVNGGAFVQGIKAQLSYGPMGPGQGEARPIKANINQQFYGPTTLPVRKILKDYTGEQLRGLKIKKVIMKASSLRGRAQATLLINGQPVGFSQTLPTTPTRLVFDLRSYSTNIVGQDIRSIKIQLQGRNMDVKMVGVRVSQQGGNHGGMNSAQIIVQQRFQGSQTVSLNQLAGYGQQVNMQKEIEALTIVAKGRGSIMLSGSRGAQNVIHVQGPTTQTLNLMGGYVTGNQVMLRVNGNLMIESIRIKFKPNRYNQW